LIVCVNNIVITGDDAQRISELKLYMQHRFQRKDLGQLRYS